MRTVLSVFVVAMCCCCFVQNSFAQNGEQVPATSDSVYEPAIDDYWPIDNDPSPLSNPAMLIEYPEDAKRAGLEGQVIVSVLINTDGSVKQVHVDKYDHVEFRDAAVSAMQKAKFTAPKKNGKPAMVWYTLPLNFRLQGERGPSNTNSSIPSFPNKPAPQPTGRK